MMSALVLAALAAVLALLPVAAIAQDASVSTDARLQMERTRKRLLVLPDPPVAQAVRDAERAAAELAPPRAVEEPARRVRTPQLDYDVTSAVQARNVQRARPR
jgi:hypothetical protein